MNKPERRPRRPFFSSGPCVKRPDWTPLNLREACLGRSHRSRAGHDKLTEVLQRTRSLLGLPDGYRLGIVPASDTGAVEMALWSLLGPRGIDVLAWESFGEEWVNDIVSELRLQDTRVLRAPYGQLPDLDQVDCERDVVFTWNGTTSGVKVPDGSWISAQRSGLTICDATSAVFAMPLPWDKLDVTTFSWQKVMGGEGAHGMLVLSPRAVERVSTHKPAWPVPKVLRLAKNGRLIDELFAGATVNTPSMLCVEDFLDTLRWAEASGGAGELIARCRRNFALLSQWVAATPWIDFLATAAHTRSETSVCLAITASGFQAKSKDGQTDYVARFCTLLEEEGVAYDINAYRAAPPGLRIWCGSTVEAEDVAALLPWLDWAYAKLAAAGEDGVN